MRGRGREGEGEGEQMEDKKEILLGYSLAMLIGFKSTNHITIFIVSSYSISPSFDIVSTPSVCVCVCPGLLCVS